MRKMCFLFLVRFKSVKLIGLVALVEEDAVA